MNEKILNTVNLSVRMVFTPNEAFRAAIDSKHPASARQIVTLTLASGTIGSHKILIRKMEKKEF
jgi:hypothetical protein